VQSGIVRDNRLLPHDPAVAEASEGIDVNVGSWQILLKKSVTAVFRVISIQDAGPDLALWR
jgi:hypothetical protein